MPARRRPSEVMPSIGCSTRYITEEELWACTSCRACVQECPVSIDQLDIINQMRRNLVLIGVALSRGDPAGVRVARAQRIAVGVQCRRPRQVGRGTGHPDDGRAGGARRAARRPVLGRLHGLVRRPREEDHRRVRANPPGVRHQLRDPRPGGALPRRSGAPHGQRVPLPDAREGHDRDARPLRGEDDRHAAARTASTRWATSFRSSAATTRSSTTRRTSSGCCRTSRVPLQTRRRADGSPSRTTTPAISAATTTSTTRRARRCGARCRSSTLVEPKRTQRSRPVLRRGRRPHVHGRAHGQAHQRRAHRGAARDGRRHDRRGLPVLHDDDQRRREGRAVQTCPCSTSPRSWRSGSRQSDGRGRLRPNEHSRRLRPRPRPRSGGAGAVDVGDRIARARTIHPSEFSISAAARAVFRRRSQLASMRTSSPSIRRGRCWRSRATSRTSRRSATWKVAPRPFRSRRSRWTWSSRR